MARHFMLPYNWKVWATPPERMACSWIVERVAPVDVDTVARDVALARDQRGSRPAWGPNATFRYPGRGGTGQLFERLAGRIRPHVRLNCPVVAVDARRRWVEVADGRRFPYDALLSTMPLDELIGALSATGSVPAAVRRAAAQLEWTSTHVVGVAVDRPTDTTRTWVYYPELDVPFHRLTYLSNYSPHLAARPGQTLLLTETSASAYKPENPATIVERVVSGLRRVGGLGPAEEPASVWHHTAVRSYPVPTLRRDAALAVIEGWLAALGIASRGRFGAWRYEIGNMDHSCMQGVEWADHVVSGSEETVWTPPCA
jgi:UDP-galactopyranose mutase